jgi:hypothetical protein
MPLEEYDYDNDRNVESEHHACARIIHGNRYISEFGEAVKRFAEPAVVTDGSGFAARLMVLPTFGCALHEPKETSPRPEGRGLTVNNWELESLHRHRVVDWFLDAVRRREIRALNMPHETEHFTVILMQDKYDGIEFTFQFPDGKTMKGWTRGVGILHVEP